MIKMTFIEGLELLSNNPKLKLERKHEDDMNGYSDIFIDKDTFDLMESYYVYDDYNINDDTKEGYARVNVNDFLYLRGCEPENVIKYLDMKYGDSYTNMDWEYILSIINTENRDRTENEKGLLQYLIDTYYSCLSDMQQSDFDGYKKYQVIKDYIKELTYE